MSLYYDGGEGAVVPFSAESGKVAYGGPPDAPVERRCP